MMSKTQETIMEALRDLCPNEAIRAQLTAETELLEAGILDSFAIVRMIQVVEEKFGVHIADRDIGPAVFASGATLTEYVERARGVEAHSQAVPARV